MTLKELQNKVGDFRPEGYGHYSYVCTFRGVDYEIITTNMEAIDRINEGEWGDNSYLSLKQAYQQLYNEAIWAIEDYELESGWDSARHIRRR